MCVSNQKMLQYSVDKTKSKMEINSANNALKLRVSKINMKFAFDYKVWSDPEWVKEDGKGIISIADSDIDLQLMLTSKNGVLRVDFSEVKIYMQEYNVTLDGNSDFSTVIELMLRNFKKFIQKEVTQMVAWRIAKSTEDHLNHLLSKGGEIIDFSHDRKIKNYWNATLLEDPVFHP